MLLLGKGLDHAQHFATTAPGMLVNLDHQTASGRLNRSRVGLNVCALRFAACSEFIDQPGPRDLYHVFAHRPSQTFQCNLAYCLFQGPVCPDSESENTGPNCFQTSSLTTPPEVGPMWVPHPRHPVTGWVAILPGAPSSRASFGARRGVWERRAAGANQALTPVL